VTAIPFGFGLPTSDHDVPFQRSVIVFVCNAAVRY